MKNVTLTGFLAFTDLMGYELFSCKPQYIEVDKIGEPNTHHFRTCGESKLYFRFDMEGEILEHGQVMPVEIKIELKPKGKAKKIKPEHVKSEIRIT
jgi:hypothetical protein